MTESKEPEDIFAQISKRLARGESLAVVTVISAEGSVPRGVGTKMLVGPSGRISGTVGGGRVEATAIETARQAIAEGKSTRLAQDLSGEAGGQVCGGRMELFIDVLKRSDDFVVVGGGHVGQAVGRLASLLGFAITVVDERPEWATTDKHPWASRTVCVPYEHAFDDIRIDSNAYIVILTHSHDRDAICARGCIGRGAAYVGMIGSQSKVAEVFSELRDFGVPESQLQTLRAPIGLDIGAETPEELAVSILAEITSVRHPHRPKSSPPGLPMSVVAGDSSPLTTVRVLVRGAGDIASAVAWALFRAGLQVVLTETDHPTAVRRHVAFSEAVRRGEAEVEGVRAVRCASPDEARSLMSGHEVIPLLIDPDLECWKELAPRVLVDARMLKRKPPDLPYSCEEALIIGLGPGFEVGSDGIDLVIETNRGHHLGRIVRNGSAEPPTGIPSEIKGITAERVLRSPCSGTFEPASSIGDCVEEGSVIGQVRGDDDRIAEVKGSIGGIIRGLLPNGAIVREGQKLGDIDPRGDETYADTISDRGRSIAGGVLLAIVESWSQV